MPRFSGNAQASGEMKGTLVARIDKRVVPALDRIAETNQANTAQLMNQFFSDIADTVEFLAAPQGGSIDTIEDRLARLIVRRSCGATPEALRAVGHIWDRAAELKAHEGGGEE